MKTFQFFKQTLDAIGTSIKFKYELFFRIKAGNLQEKVAATRDEADYCLAYLEKLILSSESDQNIQKAVNDIQLPVEYIISVAGDLLDDNDWLCEFESFEEGGPVVEYFREAVRYLCPILDLLLDRFPDFLDLDRKMPRLYYTHSIDRFRILWSCAEAGRGYTAALAPEYDWLKAPFALDAGGSPQNSLSYWDIFQLNGLTTLATNFFSGSTPEPITARKLHDLFWDENFNLEEYAAKLFEDETAGLHEYPLPEQIDKLVKIINQVRKRKRNTHGGLKDSIPLKDNLMRRLLEHLEALKLSLSISRYTSDVLPANARPPYISLNLPTVKLGYLLRYLHEHNLTTGVSAEQLINFTATFLQPASGGWYKPEELATAFHANPVISEHNVKRILNPQV